MGPFERRHLFGETDEQTARKCAAAVRAGLTPLLCVGEKLEQRASGETESVVLRQLRAAVNRLEPVQIGQMLIAYEPVWAIGTGKTAQPEDASAVHAVLRRALHEMIGGEAASVPILYGGSVNTGNARALLDSPEVDGLLVGGASLDPDGWATIVRT